MKRTCLKLLFITTLIVSFLLTPTLYAASLSLTHIGALATNGATYSEWYYTGTDPVLRGTAGDGDEVKVTIGANEYEVTADGDGNWSYQTSLSAQDYNVTISSGGEQYSFTLHAGQSMDGSATSQTTQSTSTVPPTGYNQIAGILAGSTLIAAGLYAYYQGRRSTKKAYVGEVLKSL
jgi:hypothetical protein